MPHPVTVEFNLLNIHCFDEGDGPGSAEPYVWSAFFKIDGETCHVGSDLKLHGTATVHGTPGNHGDLATNGNNEVSAGQIVIVPDALGHFRTMMLPIPLQGSKDINFGGVVGCVAILAEEDSTPDNAVAAGHAALNEALQKALNNLIPTLGSMKPAPTDQDIENVQHEIDSA